MKREEHDRRKEEWKQSTRGREIDAERELPPRRLTTEEHEFLTLILENESEDARSFIPQLEEMRAVRWCDCGCPSITLFVAEDAPPGRQMRHRLVCDLLGETAKGELVGVILFQNGGKLSLLEAYSLDGAVGPPEFGWPTVESLRAFGTAESSAPPLNE